MADDLQQLTCQCTSKSFRRVTITRPNKPPQWTPLAECTACHRAYAAPRLAPENLAKAPSPDGSPEGAREALMELIREEAKGYRKPGHGQRGESPRWRGKV